MKATPKQLSFIHVLLNQLGMADKEVKAELAFTYSAGRTSSTSELNQDEVKALINFLKKEAKQPDSPKEKMVRKILSMAHEMRWELPGGKVDMNRLNDWCVKYGYKHKPLDQHTESELSLIVTQFERMYQDFMQGI